MGPFAMSPWGVGARAAVMKNDSLSMIDTPARLFALHCMDGHREIQCVYACAKERMSTPRKTLLGVRFRPSTRLPCANAGASRRIYVLMLSHDQ